MSLWRVPIDEASGRLLGEPEPVTTPSTWSGHLSFSRDGTRLAFEHPFTGERIELVSPLPADLQAALARAERLS